MPSPLPRRTGCSRRSSAPPPTMELSSGIRAGSRAPVKRTHLSGRSSRSVRCTPWPTRSASGIAPWCCWPPSAACVGASWARCAVATSTWRPAPCALSGNWPRSAAAGSAFGPPKSKAGTRIVPIPEVIIPAIQWHLSCFALPGDEGARVHQPIGQGAASQQLPGAAAGSPRSRWPDSLTCIFRVPEAHRQHPGRNERSCIGCIIRQIPVNARYLLAQRAALGRARSHAMAGCTIA